MMLAVLIRASLEGAIVAALIWIVIRWLPRLAPATRAALWWCAAAKFLLALVWVSPVELRVLPAWAETPAALSRPAPAPAASVVTVPELPAPGLSAVIAPADDAGIDWPVVLLVLWLAGLVIGGIIDLRRLARTRSVMRRSSPATEQTAATAATLAAAIGLRRTPAVRMSSETTTPLVVGVLQPRILLPGNGAAPLSEDEERMALCHELSHVKRADLWLGLVPAAAERLFFFHPLVRLASREYLLCREAACDAAVIDTLATSPQDYGRLLLSLGVSRHRASPAVAGASSSCSILKRRIAMLRDSSPSTLGWRVLSFMVIAAAVTAAVPLRLTAGAQAPDIESTELEPVEQARPTTDQTPGWAIDDLSRLWLGPGRAWLGGFTHEGLLREPQDSRGQVYVGSGKRELNYVLLLDDHNANMSGSLADIDRARSLRRGGEAILWIRRKGVEHVVRDRTLIGQALEVWRPVNTLGDAQGDLGGKQGALGTQQGALGARQGALGMQQGVLGTRQGEIGVRQAALSAREQTAATDTDRRAVDAERRRLDSESRALEAEMRALDLKMRELDQPMRDLDREMRALGAKMEVLGREMEDASRRAEAQMLELLDRAIASGLAERITASRQELQSSSVWSRLDRLSRLERLGRLERLSRLSRLERAMTRLESRLNTVLNRVSSRLNRLESRLNSRLDHFGSRLAEVARQNQS
jgi:beta-lactamase regulating signal transducer with metallopeptidase domain